MKRLILLFLTLFASVAPLRAAFDNGQVVEATSVSEQTLLNGRVYDPQTGRFLSADPIIQDAGGLQSYNRYSYCLNNPSVYIDPSGHATYRMNRELGGSQARSSSNVLSHTFAFTAREGNITATYSWGNSANTHGWNMNQPEDIQSAREALISETNGYWDKNGKLHFDGFLTLVGGDELDPYVDEAFQELNSTENEHINWIIFNNCKTETTKLTDLATSMMDNNAPSSDEATQEETSQEEECPDENTTQESYIPQPSIDKLEENATKIREFILQQ